MGSELACQQDYRKITISGHTPTLDETIVFNVTSVENPLDAITSRMLFIKTYDGMNRNIIERTYANLDITNTPYVFKGPVLKVNKDEPIYVERGTQSVDLSIVCTEIMALNLTLTPVSEFIEFVPAQI
jgi:hypothetical protein